VHLFKHLGVAGERIGQVCWVCMSSPSRSVSSVVVMPMCIGQLNVVILIKPVCIGCLGLGQGSCATCSKVSLAWLLMVDRSIKVLSVGSHECVPGRRQVEWSLTLNERHSRVPALLTNKTKAHIPCQRTPPRPRVPGAMEKNATRTRLAPPCPPV
jgi:hypothetical protein